MNLNTGPDDELDALVRNAIDTEIPSETEQRMRRHLTGFRLRLAVREETEHRRIPMRRTLARWPLAAVLGIVIIVGYSWLTGNGAPPTWAEVSRGFASAPFLSATIYYKSTALSNPAQIELWMAQDGSWRLRAGREMSFGGAKGVHETVRFSDVSESIDETRIARELVEPFIKNLSNAGGFSLDAFVRSLPNVRMMATPYPNSGAALSSGLAVFDLVYPNSAEWIRVWALRESRLPVRLLFWDPNTEGSIDVALSYTAPQAAAFFDPEAYKAALAQTPDNGSARAYLLLKDAGGRPITSEEARTSVTPAPTEAASPPPAS
jgi:hypothetical protein